MKRIFCGILVLVLLFGVTACGLFDRTAKDWQEQYDLGMRYLEDGDYEEAILAFTAAIEIDGNRPEAYMGRAEAYIAIGEPEKALKDYKRAKRAARNSEEDYKDLLEELEEIIAELEESGNTDPGAAAGTGKQLIKVTTTVDGMTSTIATFDYNGRGLITSAVCAYPPYDDSSSATYTYVYDEEDRLIEVWTSFSESAGVPTVQYHYDENGCLTEISGIGEGGGVGGIFENDDQGRPICYTEESDFGTAITEYTYSDDGREGYATYTYTAEDGSYSSEEQIVYTYDANGRLLSEKHSGTGYWYQYTYSYDGKPFVAIKSEADASEGYAVGAMNDAYSLEDIKGHSIWTLYTGTPDTIETDEEGYVTRIVSENGIFEFFYDDNSPDDADNNSPNDADGNAPTEPVTIGLPLDYEITREDRSQYRENGTLAFEHYYDCIVVKGSGEVVQKINAAVQADMDSFLYTMDEESLRMYTDPLPDSSYVFTTAQAEVTENSGKVFSICIWERWFMGGVVTASCYGLNFDARTGEPVYLPELYAMEEADFLLLLKETCWEYLSENYASDLWSEAQDVVFGYDLSDFYYYFQDGELVVVFQAYSISYGAMGCIKVPTGLYY